MRLLTITTFPPDKTKNLPNTIDCKAGFLIDDGITQI